MSKRLTKEDKVAQKLCEIVNDLTLDLEEVGYVLSEIARNVSYKRLLVIAESAEHHREQLEMKNQPTLW